VHVSDLLLDLVLQMDDMIQEKVSQKENELNATYDEKMRNYEERSVSL
jgi:homeobox protein cut-like